MPEPQTLLMVKALVSSGSPAKRQKHVAHDDLVKIDRLQRLVIIIILFLEIRHVELSQGVRPARLYGVGNHGTKPGPLDGLFNDDRPELRRLEILQRTAKITDGRPRSADNNYLFHPQTPFNFIG